MVGQSSALIPANSKCGRLLQSQQFKNEIFNSYRGATSYYQTIKPDLLSTSLTMVLRYLGDFRDFNHYAQRGLNLRCEGRVKYHCSLDRRTTYLPVNYLLFVGKHVLLAADLVGF